MRNAFRYRERRADSRHSPATIGAVRSRARSTRIGTDRRSTEPVRREPDRLSAECQTTDSSLDEGVRRHRCRKRAERSGQRTRNGVPTRPRIPRNGVVAVIIMVGPLSVSSCQSRPRLESSGSRRVNTIGIVIHCATPFSELSEIAFPNSVGTVRGSWSRGDLLAGCGVAGPHGAGNLAPGGVTPSRVPPRSPSARRPRRRSARCHRRSRHRRPRASRCGRRPRAG